ncbi:DUF4181 domain-containing protein [Niallia circulans]|uniref:DUF4181 domain-containing protein n=1 Tax=Niallia circulans TaxID=1397 RepID=A0A553SRZ8_NIACI|nr:DUF4181 domain-containing protein [Niallia circulans]TRZ39764.1 DUF4181 domain-containing protein [Niallia circulans]
MFGLSLSFGLRLLVLLVIVFVLMFLFNYLMSKTLKVQRKKIFSDNHINEKHKKIDWTLRIITFISMLLVFPFSIDETKSYWFLQPWIILSLFLIVSEIVRAVMERKYAENPVAYKLTLSQLIFVIILFFTLFKTDFWGLF